jgi:TRAP transporter TAXI family solute receptor
VTLSRRGLLAAVPGLLAAGGLAACGISRAEAKPKLWHDGRLFIATGNTTGVFYQLGGGLADLITRYVPNYEASAEASGASGDNIQRVATGDSDLAFCNMDTAADAYLGQAAYDGKPQRITMMARIYRNYMQCVVRTGSGITTAADLRGKRISTGTLNSGADSFAGRILQGLGIDPDKDIARQRLSLPDTAKSMIAGQTDALFFTSGLPTPGISDLLQSAPGQYVMLPLDAALPPLKEKFGGVYDVATISKDVYKTPGDIQTLVVFTSIIASPDMPDQLAHDITKAIFDHQSELAKTHTEGGNFDKANGDNTAPIALHPGARRYYDQG